MYNKDYYAVIMAGGVGSRFWPVSRTAYPKQFQDIMGVGETLLQLTFNRLSSLVRPENILILTNGSYNDIVLKQLPHLSQDQIILEPEMRNTAPCILLAALKIKKKNPDAVMLVAPSDHWIVEKEKFFEDANTAFRVAAREDILITLGIKPSFPNTGYGYIKYAQGNTLQNEPRIFQVQKFAEKPSLANAQLYLEQGNYVWNAGIFIWKASVIAKAFEDLSQDLYELFNRGVEFLNETTEENFIKATYHQARNISVDYAILEKSEHVYVIPATFDWDDLGTWGSLYGKLAKDENENAVVNARLMPGGNQGNIIYTHDHKVVVIEGLQDFIIVDSDDVLLIVPKDREQEIKEMRAKAMRELGDNLG